MLEWVGISFSNAWKWKVKVKLLSCVWLLATPWTITYQGPPSMGFSRKEYWSVLPLASPEKLNPAQIKDRDHTFLILKVKETFPTIQFLESQKGRGTTRVGGVNLPTVGFFTGIPSWLRDARAHLGGSWDIPNTDSGPIKAKWLARGNLEETPHISDFNYQYHEGTHTSPSPWSPSHFPPHATPLDCHRALVWAVLGLCCCVQAFSGCSKWGLLSSF